jgi:hypothetical protein
LSSKDSCPTGFDCNASYSCAAAVAAGT